MNGEAQDGAGEADSARPSARADFYGGLFWIALGAVTGQALKNGMEVRVVQR